MPPAAIVRGLFRFALSSLFVIGAAGAADAATYTVINANDSGPGSLHQAILDANATPEADTIEFAAALSGQTIVLGSSLSITSTITVNGLGANRLSVSGNDQFVVFIVDQFADLTLRGLTITRGDAMNSNSGYGGGVSNSGRLTVSDCTLTRNHGQNGGGLHASPASTSTRIINSTFSNNTAEFGGGIYVEAPDMSTSIVNSTFSGNSVISDGGGLFSLAVVTATNSTFTGNSANGVGGGLELYVDSYLGNTIVAGNDAAYEPDVSGPVWSQGHNLIGRLGFAFPGWDSTDQIGTLATPVAALLGPLQDNGGSTFTHALLPGSPAIDGGSNALAVDAAGVVLPNDQRGTGFPRVVNAAVDIGALEVQPAPPAYDFTGFFAPVENLPLLNVSKAGSSIPLKFSLNGDQGLAIFAAGYPSSSAVACDANEPGTTVTETIAAGHSSLTYDAASDRYQYVWKTDKSWKGTCRVLVVGFTGGITRTAKFRFQ